MYNKDQKQKHLVTILKGKIYHNTLQWNNGVGGGENVEHANLTQK